LVNGTVVSSGAGVVVGVVSVVDIGVEALVVDFLPLTSAFADFVVLAGFVVFAAFVVDFTGFVGLLAVVFTGLTFVDVGLTAVETEVCVGLGGFTGFGFGPP
jgi:hypothetical protein